MEAKSSVKLTRIGIIMHMHTRSQRWKLSDAQVFKEEQGGSCILRLFEADSEGGLGTGSWNSEQSRV